MSTIVSLVTAEDLVAMPKDGIERELIRGVVREKPMTYRGRMHSRMTGRISFLLLDWLRQFPEMGGDVFDGEIAVRLCRNPETTVGIDVAYVSREVLDQTPPEHFFIEGAPILAVEVLSPSDSLTDIADKVALYLEYGVAVVWVVNPRFQTITVHRRDVAPTSLDLSDELSGEPELPGFQVSMKTMFD